MMSTSPTQTAPLGGTTMLAAGLAASVPGILIGLRANDDLWSGGLLNPDGAMRLVRLHDIIAAGQPLHAVMRDASGMGNVLPWSHLLDSLLLLLAAPLAPLFGWDTALHLAGLASGPLAMAGLGIAIAWAAAPFASRMWLWLGAFAAGVAPVLAGYGLLGVVHHHVLLTVVPVVMGGWTVRLLHGLAEGEAGRFGAGPIADPIADPIVGQAASIGAWAAAGVWLSPEALPFALMVLGALWVTWLTAGPAARPPLTRALLVSAGMMALLVSLAWAVDPPATGWGAIEPDRISLPFVLLALGAAATATVACLTGRRLPTLVCGGVFAGLFLLGFPQFLRGTGGLMTAEEAEAFFTGIGEMASVTSLDQAMRCLLGGVFATTALLGFAMQDRSGWREARLTGVPLLYAAVCSLVLVALAAAHVRFTVYPAAAGAVLLPVVLSSVGGAGLRPAFRAVTRAVVAMALLAGPILAPNPASASTQATAARACKLSGAVALLAGHSGEVVLTGVNQAPDLLYATGIRTVGSLYHRAPRAYMRLRAAWRAVPGDAPGEAFRATGASLVLGCPGEARPYDVHDLPRTTLQDRLIAGDPPRWLHRVGDAGPRGYVLYRVED